MKKQDQAEAEAKMQAIDEIGLKMSGLYKEAFTILEDDLDACAAFIAVIAATTTINYEFCPHCVMKGLNENFVAIKHQIDNDEMPYVH